MTVVATAALEYSVAYSGIITEMREEGSDHLSKNWIISPKTGSFIPPKNGSTHLSWRISHEMRMYLNRHYTHEINYSE
jgi:hypothetical protein